MHATWVNKSGSGQTYYIHAAGCLFTKKVLALRQKNAAGMLLAARAAEKFDLGKQHTSKQNARDRSELLSLCDAQ
jgi:hypothetical protein